jgi:diaminopimelate decarboxylase
MARKGPGTEHPMTTARILDFIRTRRPDGPCLVVDLDVVRDNFQSFRKALPDSSIFYAVKANPAPEILRLLANLGSNFDCASVAEIEMAMKAGSDWTDRVPMATPSRKNATLPAPTRSACRCLPSTATRKSRRSPVPHPARACSAAC